MAVLAATSAQAQWNEFGGVAGSVANTPLRGGTPGARGSGFYLTPTFRVSQTLTDNANLRSTDTEWDAITQATVGVNGGGRFGAVTGSLAAALTGTYHARGTSDDSADVNLRASGTAELVRDRVFVDGYARVGQRLIDPFGVQPSDPLLSNDNTTTTLDYGISPYAQGTIGGLVDYYARVNLTGSANAESSAYGFEDYSAVARLDGSTPFTRLRWGLAFVARASAYGDEVRADNYGATATLSYAVTPYFRVRGNAGVEYQNYVDADVTRRTHLYGGGFDWQPTDRTVISAGLEKRFFGNAYFASFQHRTPRTTWSYRARQGVSEIGGVTGVSLGTYFDLFFRQFESIEPDPVKREQLVLEFLRANGIAPDDQAVLGLLTARIQLQRSHDLSFSWLVSRRTTLAVAAGQSDSSDLIDFLGADGFDTRSFVRSRRLNVNVSHQLTPSSSVSFLAGRTVTEGREGDRSTTQDRYLVNWGTTLSSRSRVDVTARRVDFDSPTRPYTEHAVIATFNLRF